MAEFKLPDLQYATDTLQPYMSAETLEFHHGKHHQTYITNLNNLLKGHALENATLEEIIKQTYNKDEAKAIFNNASQHYNHVEFWKMMKKNTTHSVPENVKKAIEKDFSSLDEFKDKFIQQGLSVFGSGWVWLAKNNNDKLEIITTTGGVNPIALGKKDILGCDVWEHSYYIDYRNKRADYLKAWFENLINWEYVESKI